MAGGVGGAGPGGPPLRTLEAMHRIRREQMEVQEFLMDLQSWEKDIGKKDEALRRKEPAKTVERAAAVRDVSKAVAVPTTVRSTREEAKEASGGGDGVKEGVRGLTPAALGGKGSAAGEESGEATTGARAKQLLWSGVGRNKVQKREDWEKELGNDAFRAGDFAQAVTHYTRCLGMDPGFAVAYNNRALAHLKLREYARAEDDATSALDIADRKETPAAAADGIRVKALLRRAAARKGLGKLVLAMEDLLTILDKDPAHKEARSELRKVRDLRRTAARRAPQLTLPVPTATSVAAAASRPTTAPAPAPQMHKDPGRKVEEVVKEVVEGAKGEKKEDEGQGARDKGRKKETGSEERDRDREMGGGEGGGGVDAVELAARAARVVREAGKGSSAVPQKAPSTGFELEKQLRALKENPDALFAFLTEVVTPTRLARIYKRSGMEATVVVQILAAVEAGLEGTEDYASILAWFESIATTKRFTMTRALFSSKDRDRLRTMLSHVSDSPRVAAIRENFKI